MSTLFTLIVMAVLFVFGVGLPLLLFAAFFIFLRWARNSASSEEAVPFIVVEDSSQIDHDGCDDD